jgi:hypothetical protein
MSAGHWSVWSFGFMQRLTLERYFLEYISTDGVSYIHGFSQRHRRVVSLPWVVY